MKIRCHGPGHTRGSVTAELALALPTLVLVLTFGLWLQATLALEARCLDAARAGARAAARGDPDPQIRSILSTALPHGATVLIRRSGAFVTVTVTARSRPPAGLGALVSGAIVAGSATGAAESAP